MRHYLTLTVVAAVLAAASGLLTLRGYASPQAAPAAQGATGASGASGATGSAAAKNQAPAPAAGAAAQSARAYWDAIRQHPRPLVWGILAALLIIAAGVVVQYRTIKAGDDPLILRLTPSFFFWLGMIYTGLLLLMAAVYNLTKDPNAGATVFGGIVPIAVPWFGALGAVTISLEGVFAYNDKWDKKFNYWHIGRPIFGAVLGIVAFFLFVVIVSAAGSAPKFLEGGGATAKDYIIFYVVAFLVGYREETFRELIKRATDLVLKPSPAAAPAAPAVTIKVGGATPPEIAFDPTAVNAPARKTVDIHNSGTAPLTLPAVTIAPVAPTPEKVFAIDKDQITKGGDLAPGQSRSLDITFTPAAAGSFAATLSVTGTNLTSPKTIRVGGKAQ